MIVGLDRTETRTIGISVPSSVSTGRFSVVYVILKATLTRPRGPKKCKAHWLRHTLSRTLKKFNAGASLEELWSKLSGKLEITPEDVKKKTDEAIYVDFGEAAELIRDLGGIVTTHAGGKSNSIENIGNNTPSRWH